MKRRRVKKEEIGPGYYLAFNSDHGLTFHFKVVDHPTEGLCAWGLSMYRRSIGYRTLGMKLPEWLARPDNSKIVIYEDDNQEEK
jgi:hypothetical protein